MKRLLFVIVAAFSIWAGYWYFGASAAKSGFAAWFEDRRQQGWQAEYSDLTVRGFPNRFDATFTTPILADPNTGWSWEAPFLQLFALSYRPNHVIAVWPNSQLIATPNEKFDVSSSDMRASLVLGDGTDLPLIRSNVVVTDLALSAREAGGITRIASLRAAVQKKEDGNRYKVAVTADGFALSLPLKSLLDPSDRLPNKLNALRADLSVAFDRSWDRTAIEHSRPQPRELHLSVAEAKWGELELLAAGKLNIDAQGVPSGTLNLKAKNWREIIAMGVASGAVSQNLAPRLEQGLSVLAQLSGNTKTLDLELTFSRGRVALGPIPLGPAPIIRLR